MMYWKYSYFYNINVLMYQKQASLFLQILEYSNLAIILFFLLLFIYRLFALRSFSFTDKFQNYFPKLRIFFCIVYIILSVSLLTYNLATNSYTDKKWFQYVLQGGGGECIDSVILFIQLAVLRLELKKQQPYSLFHIYYFVYLMVMSLARLVLTTIDVLVGQNDIANEVIAFLLAVDSTVQFAYWIRHKQSLPQFVSPTHQQIDQLRYHSQFLQKILSNNKKSIHGENKDNFPYLVSFISIQNGKIRISIQKIICQQLRFASNESLNQSFLTEHQNIPTQQLVTSHLFTMDDIKTFYIICGRFQIKHKLSFDQNMFDFIKELQLFLDQLLAERKWYQSNILKFLRVPEELIMVYRSRQSKINSDILTGIDPNTGFRMEQDTNGMFFSIVIYRFMWVIDHYQFYMRVILRDNKQISYPIKRLQQIEENFNIMKRINKIQNHNIQLPHMPKKYPFIANDDVVVKENIKELELYIRKLANDENVMEVQTLKSKILQFLGFQKYLKSFPKYNSQYYNNLTIKKGRISKALIKDEYVTLYEFKLIKNGMEIKPIIKRFRQIVQLHQEIERCFKNKKIFFALNLPEKIIYKPEIRHEKLKVYLENIIEIKEIWKIYAVNVFFQANLEDRNSTKIDDLTKLSTQTDEIRLTLKRQSLFGQINQKIEQIQNSPQSQSSRMFSQIMDDLGNQDLD